MTQRVAKELRKLDQAGDFQWDDKSKEKQSLSSRMSTALNGEGFRVTPYGTANEVASYFGTAKPVLSASLCLGLAAGKVIASDGYKKLKALNTRNITKSGIHYASASVLDRSFEAFLHTTLKKESNHTPT